MRQTIPASNIVTVLPGVLAAGGTALDLNGVMLTDSWRVPAGQAMNAPSAESVGAFFGYSSPEYAKAVIYFASYIGATRVPGALLIANANLSARGAWLLGGKFSTLTIPQINALSGSLTVTVDGYTRTAASIDLSAATSYSAAAALIQTGLNATPVSSASFTGAIAPGSAAVTGSISGTVLTVSAVASGTLVPGALISGTGIAAGTRVEAQISGTTGGVGSYAVSAPHAVSNVAIAATYGVLTVSAVASGTLSIGQTITGGATAATTMITGLGTGTGLTGTYYVSQTQTVASGALTAQSTPVSVSFDSTSGALLIRSGFAGSESTINFATGTLAAGIRLTTSTGATNSQGAAPKTPGESMSALKSLTQNWATFFTLFDPDAGNGNAQKMAYAKWANDQGNRFAYLGWDADAAPTLSSEASTSFGYLVGEGGENYSGVVPIYDPNNTGTAAFLAGYAASLDFDSREGRTTAAFREQEGLSVVVDVEQIASNLTANGYNFYGAYGTSNDAFIHLHDGRMSGPFMWLDSYLNQIWMNNQFQLDLMVLLRTMNSIPYNDAGRAMQEASLQTTIQQAKNFGAIREGIDLSATQKLAVNTAAGFRIDDVLFARGYYVLIQNASPQTRQARKTMPFKFFYTDGQSVQQITMNSIELI